MSVLNIKDLRDKMILAEDVKDNSGRLLISKGTVLTEKSLKIMKMWGIVEADIEDADSRMIKAVVAKTVDEAALAAASEVVRKRFCHTDADHPAIRELIRLSVQRIASGRDIDLDKFRERYWFEEEIEEMERKKPIIISPAQCIHEDTKLSTLPEVYQQILDAISKPSSSAYDIENVINKDANLSACLLKIVNSAFYGYPSQIDTLSRAVNIVGTKQLSTLAIGVNVITMFKDIPPDIIDMKMFWKHSVLCGICARILAGYKNIQNTERLFVAGLLHDIGRLVLYNYRPQEALYAVTTARKMRHLLYLEEKDIWGLDHAEMSGRLLTTWQMPMSLEDAVHHHHEPQKAANQAEASLVHVADLITNTMGVGTSGERLIPPLDREAWAQIGLSPNTMSATMAQADRQLADIFELIYPNETKRKA